MGIKGGMVQDHCTWRNITGGPTRARMPDIPCQASVTLVRRLRGVLCFQMHRCSKLYKVLNACMFLH